MSELSSMDSIDILCSFTRWSRTTKILEGLSDMSTSLSFTYPFSDTYSNILSLRFLIFFKLFWLFWLDYWLKFHLYGNGLLSSTSSASKLLLFYKLLKWNSELSSIVWFLWSFYWCSDFRLNWLDWALFDLNPSFRTNKSLNW